MVLVVKAWMAGVLACLQAEGPLPTGAFDAPSILRAMSEPDELAQGLTFLDLFAQGMTDMARSVFFSMGLVAEIRAFPRSGFGKLGVRPAEHAFVDRYVELLVRHDLARVDYATWIQT